MGKNRKMGFVTALRILLSGKGENLSQAKARCQTYLQKREAKIAARKAKKLLEVLKSMSPAQRDELIKQANGGK
jgi:hypothetical protein